jgi:hypothetical protein
MEVWNMKAQRILAVIILLICRTSLAVDVCVVGAGIDNEDGKLTYMSGIGSEGAEPKSIKAMNADVQKVLENAAIKMDAKIQFCMKGKQNKEVFEVFEVTSKKLN